MIERLTALGFSTQEARVYLALLQHPSATGYELAKHAGLQRANVYQVLATLSDRHIVERTTDSQPALEHARKLVAALTEREAEVLGCLGEGPSNGQIASRLYLSEATVKGYVSRMLVKLGCANRTQAGLLAHDAGIVPGS